jgi:tetratricopeptide (TPR) repeat protein
MTEYRSVGFQVRKVWAAALFLGGIALALALCREASLPLPPGRDRSDVTRDTWREQPGPTGTRRVVHQLCALTPLPAQAVNTPGSPQDKILNEAEDEVEQGHLDEALEKCRQVLSADPHSAYAYFLAGVIEFERGANENARTDLEQSVTLAPSRVASRVALGKVYINLKQWPKARSEFQRAIDLGDTSGSGQFGLGLALLKESHPAEALPHLAAAVKADPKEWEWQFTLVATELSLKQVVNARRHLAHLDQIPNPDPWASFHLGKVLEEHDLVQDAQARFEIAIARWKASPNLQPGATLSDLELQIAHAQYDHRDFAGALDSLSRVDGASLDSKSQADALNLQGLALVRTGKLDEGSPKLEQAAEQNPSSPDYAYDRVWAELLAGHTTQAAEGAEKAERQWPNNPDIQILRAITRQELLPERARIPFLANWHLKGEGFVCCPCKVPCPCRSNGPATYGHCESAGAYRIRKGIYHHVRLDGLVFVEADACMGQEKVPALIYVQPSASTEQIICMERILQSLDPLRPFVFLSVNRAQITFETSEQGKLFEVKVPGAVEMRIRRRLNSEGKPLLETAALDRFSNVIEYAQNLTYKLWDQDGKLKSDYSGRQANYRVIDLDAREVRDLQMLHQYANGAGYFNQKQLELIERLKLPKLPSYPVTSQ